MSIFFPGVGIEMNWILLVVLGLALGVCTGFFGIGGGFMVTPGFNMLGMPMPFAIGTDLMQMSGKAVISTLKHGRLGNVDLRLGIIMVVGTMSGVEVGKQVVMLLEGMGNVDLVVRYIYILFLAGLGIYMLRESLKNKGSHGELATSRDTVQTPLVKKIQSLKLPPYISLPVSGIERISIWMPLAIGFVTGIMAGLLGVGGGFIRVPALIYLLGVPTVVAIGTDLFEIIISGGYGALTFALADRIDMLAAIITMVAASAGVQVGVVATKYVHGAALRKYFACTILLAGVSVALKQAGGVLGLNYLDDAGTYLLFASAGGISLLIAGLLLKGYLKAKSLSPIERFEKEYGHETSVRH